MLIHIRGMPSISLNRQTTFATKKEETKDEAIEEFTGGKLCVVNPKKDFDEIVNLDFKKKKTIPKNNIKFVF